MSLSTGEARVLTQVCDTIFPSLDGQGDFMRRKASDFGVDLAFAETIGSSLQPRNSQDLRRVLRVFDSRVYNLMLTGRPSKFTSMSPAGKEAYLKSWRDSQIALKRTAFQAVKRLTCFLAYAAEGPAGGNPNWPEIGYPGPSSEPAAPVPDTLRLISMEIGSDAKLVCDVVVVGSGAGGSVIAEELAAAGHDVLVIEQGKYENSETFRQSEASMMQKLFQQSGTAATRDLSFVLLAGRGAGGGTTVNWNTCLKPPKRVLSEWEDDFGVLGVAGDRFSGFLDDVWKSIGVSTAESQLNENNRPLYDGCTKLGFKEGKDFHIIERNAKGCEERCDFCTYGCRYGCKQSTALTYLPAAQTAGARFLFETRVESVKVVDGSARGVDCTHRSGGRTVRVDVEAKVVVVAAGGIETPALLLRSGIKDRNIGNFLRLDPTEALVGVFDRHIDPWKGPPQTVAVWKFIDLDGTYHGFWVEAAPAHPGLYALSLPWQDGRSHKEFMAKYYSRSAASIVLLRERSFGRVTIDKRGYPEVDYRLGGEDASTLLRGMEETAKILAAAGAQSVWTTHNDPVTVGVEGKPISSSDLDRFSSEVRSKGVAPNRVGLFSAHLMGSCRMSRDPAMGPTSPTGELHSVRNLYIGDACVFPTTPAVNPMVTIMAMARRTSESIKAALGGQVPSPNVQ